MTTGTVSLLLSPGSASQQGPTRPVRMFTVSAAVLVPFAIPPLVRFTATDFIKFRSRSPAPLHDVKRRRGRPSVFLQRQKKKPSRGQMARALETAIREVRRREETCRDTGRTGWETAWLGFPAFPRADRAAHATAVLETTKQAERRRS